MARRALSGVSERPPLFTDNPAQFTAPFAMFGATVPGASSVSYQPRDGSAV